VLSIHVVVPIAY